MNSCPFDVISSALQEVATGPELSKSISLEHARSAMELIVDQQVDPVQAGIFLIAMRMKRETDEENSGMFSALRERSPMQRVNCETVIEIGDPFNGFLRTLPASPFLPAVLASCGICAYSHGVERTGPKYGVTHAMVLKNAGIDTGMSLENGRHRLESPDQGWCYLDQAAYFPALSQLLSLRTKMVKRTCLTTYETLLGPFRGENSHLLNGFVHKNYPQVYSQLARESGFDGAAIVRGVEGGCIASLSQPSRYVSFTGKGGDRKQSIRPQDVGIERRERGIPIPQSMQRENRVSTSLAGGSAQDSVSVPIDVDAAAAETARLGLGALSGEPGPMRDSLIYGGAVCLVQCGQFTNMQQAAQRVRSALDHGDAMARFDALRGN